MDLKSARGQYINAPIGPHSQGDAAFGRQAPKRESENKITT